MSKKITFLATALSASLLTGCGAGNVVGGALGLSEVLEDSGAGQTPAGIQADAPLQPVSADSAATPTELTQLFGSGSFQFGFTNSSTVFSLQTAFDQNSVGVSNEGNFSVFTVGTLFSTNDGGNTFENNGPRAVYCTFIDSVSKYLCLVELAEGATANFLSDRFVGNQSSGSFEFCDTNVSTEMCINGLANEPDGPVLLTVQPATNALAAISLSQSIDIAEYNTDAENRMRYLEQGTIDFNINNGIERQRSASQGDLENARRQLLTR